MLGVIAVYDDLGALADNSELHITISAAWLPFLIAIPPLVQVIYVLWVVRHKGRGPKADLAVRFKPVDLGIGAVLFFVGIALATVLALGMEWLFGTFPTAALTDMIEDTDGAPAGINGWIVLLAVVAGIVVPVLEEIVYRGLLWSALEKRGMREQAVLVVTSLIFAAIHLEPARFPILFVLGIALGYGRIRTGRIGSCVAAHIYLNSTGMIALLATM